MTNSDKTNEAEKLIGAGSALSGLTSDAIASEAVRNNLKTALLLAGTIEDIGFEAAPVFRA